MVGLSLVAELTGSEKIGWIPPETIEMSTEDIILNDAFLPKIGNYPMGKLNSSQQDLGASAAYQCDICGNFAKDARGLKVHHRMYHSGTKVCGCLFSHQLLLLLIFFLG